MFVKPRRFLAASNFFGKSEIKPSWFFARVMFIKPRRFLAASNFFGKSEIKPSWFFFA
jgi:hypothetical protein